MYVYLYVYTITYNILYDTYYVICFDREVVVPWRRKAADASLRKRSVALKWVSKNG